MAESPGGICASYYVVPGEKRRLPVSPADEQAYRFEIGGGHWLWGSDALILQFLRSFVALKSYARRAAVYFPDRDTFVPYPLQNHLRYLGREMAVQILREMHEAARVQRPVATMADWFEACFGPTLSRLFFHPFHELYTAGLWRQLAAQDDSKSPVDLWMATQGAFEEAPQGGGYNPSFLYPSEGLNALVQRLAAGCDIHYGRRVVKIDPGKKTLAFADGTVLPYSALLCTLPLNSVLKMTGLEVPSAPDPFTSVMVVNIGARKGPRCPQENWLYIPRSETGFHRVGFYSNVDPSFLPRSARPHGEFASIYVENAYVGGRKPGAEEVESLCQGVVRELQAWDWIKQVEVVDPTWVETAYSWTRPGSAWRQEALRILEAQDIYPLGRYGRWATQLKDQGIAQSLRAGLLAGACVRRPR
jgi:protoporphyrinogen oxidase